MNLPKYLPPDVYNPILDTDSYKVAHWKFYRTGTERVYSYLESRGGENDEIMTAGINPVLYKFGQPIELWMLDAAEDFFGKHFMTTEYTNKKLWKDILNLHDGKLPLKIKHLPEGLLVPKRTPMLTVENTVDGMAALTSYLESPLLSDVWPACSIATRVFRMKQRIKPFFDRTSMNGVSPFALLDFSRRGTFGLDHAKMAGAVFCFMFKGSDNMPGIAHANKYYFNDMAAWSVAATEHSIACGYGPHNDDDYISDAIDRVPAGAILSLVGDTWNIYEFAKKLVKYKDRIAAKDVKLVCRPDSGNWTEVLRTVLAILADGFGTTKNDKGFEVINYNIKALWADGMNEHTVIEPFKVAEDMRISADSVMTGAGGGIASADLDRDTDRWAFKASEYCMADGTRLDIAKNPITDPGKVSKSGRFGVIRHRDGSFETIKRIGDAEDERDLLETHFLNGDVLNPSTLDQIRERVDAQL